ncbi:probable basic-leucine zipper transcription factor Q [Topomyia yanbarensis]|uniref:probable basic-leucine zipper transcription factor Q n=1 Tax=Topomyia yanbarensis TaxID=2498891 RepID=UPI00273BC819|nr:probable basic-leucine zipper transcription factor Q [Topomyia yanbarensis]
MKWIIVLTVLVSLLTLQATAASEKKPEKRPTKKASSAKPTKTPKSIVEEFTGLPPDDIDFIKELDRQFNEHGNKIRIKIQRDNSTGIKSVKRTIDGDLGYGHYSNQPEGGYHFSKPKFMLYPYAHHNSPVKATHTSEETVTELEITPSHSYELKPIEEVYQIYPTNYHQEQQYYQHQQQQQQHQDSPVIVLKIPGPAKYAQHLQALLQQYLEIRAAQLYKELQEQEFQHQQHAIELHQQKLIQQQQQYYHPQQPQHQNQHQTQHVQTTKYSQPDPYQQSQEEYVPVYKPSPFVPVHGHYYESPKHRPTQPSYRKPVVIPTHIAYHSSPEPDNQAYQYETYHQHQESPQHQAHIQYQYIHQEQQPPSAPEEHHQQYVYQKPLLNFVTPIPDQEEPSEHYQPPPKYQNFAQYHAHHQPAHQEGEEYLPEPKLVENYPSDKHTRVVYKSQSLKTHLQQASHEQQEYAIHHHQQEQPEDHGQQQYLYQTIYSDQALEDKSFHEPVTPEAINDLHSHASSPAPDIEPRYNEEAVVAITQKPKRLYNYHAGPSRSHRMHATRSASNKSDTSGSNVSNSDTSNEPSSKTSTATKASNKRDAPYTEEQFKKINKMVHRIKKKSQSVSTTARSVASTKKSQ